MQSRIERAAQAGQQALAEQELHMRLGGLLTDLTKRILTSAVLFAAERAAHETLETRPPTDHVVGQTSRGDDDEWDLPSMAAVTAVMEEVRKLIEDRPAAVAGVTAALTLYAAFVRLLLAHLVAPVTAAALAGRLDASSSSSSSPSRSAVPGVSCASALSDVVCVPSAPSLPPASSSSLLAPGCVLRVPAAYYVGQRCAKHLLLTVGGLLRVSREDAAAARLDVCTATLRGVLESPVPDDTSTAPTHAARLQTFCVSTDAGTRALHCLWWWCSNMFTDGVCCGWLSHPSVQAAGHVSADVAAVTPHDEQGKSEFCQLWSLGRAEAAVFAGTHLASASSRYLHAALAQFVLAPQTSSSAAAELMEALRAVRSVTQRVFPCADARDASSKAAPGAPSTAIDGVDGGAAAAGAEFTRMVVHDALFPLAERVLDEPALLPHGQMPAFAAPARMSEPCHGWSDDDEDDGEDGAWAEVSVEKVTSSSAASGGPPSPTHASGTRATGPSGQCTPLVYAMDALESVFGEAVRSDRIAVTLRRL